MSAASPPPKAIKTPKKVKMPSVAEVPTVVTVTPPKANLPVIPTGTPIPLPAHLRSALQGVASRQLSVDFGECLAWLLCLPTLWLVQATADWFLNIPWFSRLLLLTGDVVVAGGIIYWFGFRAWKRKMNLRAAALRVENDMPDFKSSLISAVELAHTGIAPGQGSGALIHELISRVSQKVKTLNLAGTVVKKTRLLRAWKYAVGALVLTAVCAALAWDKAPMLIARILLSSEPLPTKTLVYPITENMVVPVGSNVTLSARAEGEIPRSGRVVLLYDNGDRQEITANSTVSDEKVFSLTVKNVQQTFKYRITLNDGATQNYEVIARPAPSLATFKCIQTYPDYTEMGKMEMSTGGLTLLAGSKIRIEGKATQPLKSAGIDLQGMNKKVDLVIDKSDPSIVSGEFTVPKEGLTGFALPLVNSDGIPSVNDTVYRVDLTADKAPVIEMSFPTAEKMTVILKAKPRLVFSARDDFQLSSLKVMYELTRPVKPGAEEPPPEKGEIKLPLAPKTAAVNNQTFVWDFAAQKPAWTEGCTISYWVEAADNNNVTGPSIGESPKKTLAIITEAEKRAELLENLGAKAAEIDGLSNKQKKVNETLDSTIRKN